MDLQITVDIKIAIFKLFEPIKHHHILHSTTAFSFANVFNILDHSMTQLKSVKQKFISYRFSMSIPNTYKRFKNKLNITMSTSFDSSE